MPKMESFERFSDEYDEWFERNVDIYEAELEAIRRLMPSAGSDGLEVGVGSGRFAARLGVQFGVEPSSNMALKARERGVRVLSGVAEKLPFPDARFDLVLMVTVICFADDVGEAFREAWRVLKPGGCILVAFIDRESDLGKLYADKGKSSKFYEDASFFSTGEVLGHLVEAGFTDDKIGQTLIPGETGETVLDGYGVGAFIVIRCIKL